MLANSVELDATNNPTKACTLMIWNPKECLKSGVKALRVVLRG